ncbi:hypothetical protein AK812_SmicGene31358 [Symbiodinium microadriaticum]|uniref:Ubiquitin-like domain-containing protein n=1 Tax=Symbiodinium microadriaticum TaxID=2951 RepID=A0A1Q9CWW4_SYMMI|nr:hypothetical protein AK812_SmicGene31358 [Symbiodinium microadriaticum]
MAFSLCVTLLSGRRAELHLPVGATADDLRRLAEQELDVRIEVLILKTGRCLAPSEKLADAGLEDGATVTAKVRGSVQTTGNNRFGGDCSAVQAQLNNVEQICASEASFAAIRSDGCLPGWALPEVRYWRTRSQTEDRQEADGVRLDARFARLCQKLHPSCPLRSFGTGADGGIETDARSLNDFFEASTGSEEQRSVVAWGNPRAGGCSCAVQHRLRDVVQIAANPGAFAAIRADGEVVPWGGVKRGGVCASAPRQVTQIQATVAAFAAIGADGSVTTWGSKRAGGDSAAVKDQLQGVESIQASSTAFAAIRSDGFPCMSRLEFETS